MMRFLNLKIVFADTYEQLQKEWEENNKIVDQLTAQTVKDRKTINSLKLKMTVKDEKILELEARIAELERKPKRGRPRKDSK